MNHSTTGLPVHHQLLEFTQIHIHWVNDAIQPSHPPSSPSPPAPNPSQHQNLFQWVNSWHEVARVLDGSLASCRPRGHKESDSTEQLNWTELTIVPPGVLVTWSFQMRQLFSSGGQSVGVLASTSVLPMNTQDWSPLGWTGWISLQSKGLSRVFSNTTVQKHQSFGPQLSL